MDSIKNWCIVVSGVSVVSGIITALIPRGSTKNTYRVLTCIVLLYAMIQPVTQWREMKIDFNKLIGSESEGGVVSWEKNDSVVFVAEETYEKHIDSLIRKTGADAKSECVCEYSDGELKLIEITVTGQINEHEKENIANEIQNVIQETTIVKFRGDSG